MRFLFSSILVAITLVSSFTAMAQKANSEAAFAEQIATLTTQIESNPNDAQLYIERAKAGFNLNRVYKGQTSIDYTYTSVLDDVTKAIEISPETPLFYSIRAYYKKLISNNLEGAVEDIDQAISLDPENPQWYYERTNYVNIIAACKDWEKCASLGDKRCQDILEQVCDQKFGEDEN